MEKIGHDSYPKKIILSKANKEQATSTIKRLMAPAKIASYRRNLDQLKVRRRRGDDCVLTPNLTFKLSQHIYHIFDTRFMQDRLI